MESYSLRRRSELRELGTIINVAMGEHPERLEDLTKPAPAPEELEKWWEMD